MPTHKYMGHLQKEFDFPEAHIKEVSLLDWLNKLLVYFPIYLLYDYL